MEAFEKNLLWPSLQMMKFLFQVVKWLNCDSGDMINNSPYDMCERIVKLLLSPTRIRIILL